MMRAYLHKMTDLRLKFIYIYVCVYRLWILIWQLWIYVPGSVGSRDNLSSTTSEYVCMQNKRRDFRIEPRAITNDSSTNVIWTINCLNLYMYIFNYKTVTYIACLFWLKRCPGNFRINMVFIRIWKTQKSNGKNKASLQVNCVHCRSKLLVAAPVWQAYSYTVAKAHTFQELQRSEKWTFLSKFSK